MSEWRSRAGVPFMIWVCPRCGLIRSNKYTHKHGEVYIEAPNIRQT